MRTLYVYTTADDVPEHLRCTAYFKDGAGLFGVRFNGPTPEAVRKTAEKWWVEETARQAKIKGGRPAAKIADGLKEALAVAKGEAEPFATHTFDPLDDL